MLSVYYENLIQRVLDNSQNNTWDKAVKEWYIYSCQKDESCQSQCVCGKENIKYLFVIKNLLNKKMIFPIGSSCIKKFGRNDLNEQISICEQLFDLLNLVRNNKYISIEHFSRKLLAYLYERGAFKPTAYNQFNGINDYNFMVDMFNKRKEPTKAQKSKIRGIIFYSIVFACRFCRFFQLIKP